MLPSAFARRGDREPEPIGVAEPDESDHRLALLHENVKK
jgi:hypothetical protein